MLRLSALAGALARIDAEGGRPAAFGAQPTDPEVATVVSHLVPIRSRAALAASYAREGRRLLEGGFPVGPSGPVAADAVDAIDIAYALRWMQLGEALGAS